MDSCGVCNGDHSSCDTVVHVAVTFTEPVEEQAVEKSVLEHLSSKLAITTGNAPLDMPATFVLLSLDAGGQSLFLFVLPANSFFQNCAFINRAQ